MSHLTTETLARLVDEHPAPLEAAHLAECDACRAELGALREQVHAMGELGEIEPPAHAWDDLHERLADEGLVRTNRQRALPAYMRIAAALVLFFAGTAAGFTWRGATLPQQVAVAPSEQAGSDVAAQQDRVTSDASASVAPDATAQPDDPASRPGLAAGSSVDTPADAPRTDVVEDGSPAPQLASSAAAQSTAPARDAQAADTGARNTDGIDAPRGEPRITGRIPADPRYALVPFDARNAQEAAMALRDAESLYLDALAQFAQVAGGRNGDEDPVARLVALESIVLSTREALDRAPADPIINGYHMTAVAQRDATLRQLAAQSRDPWF